jgi:4-hydroxy-4-methyl-2-oxoglutarate aldolase
MGKPNLVPTLTTEELEVLRRLDPCTQADAIETFHVRLRNEGFMDGPVRCLFPQLQPVVGYAATILIRGATPAFAGPPFHDHTDLWEFSQSLPPAKQRAIFDICRSPEFSQKKLREVVRENQI